jgi:hypothetical protein
MKRFIVVVVHAACARTFEDGSPDPPVRQLVPCDPDVGPSAPLACPSGRDAAVPDLLTDQGAD